MLLYSESARCPSNPAPSSRLPLVKRGPALAQQLFYASPLIPRVLHFNHRHVRSRNPPRAAYAYAPRIQRRQENAYFLRRTERIDGILLNFYQRGNLAQC